MRYNELIGENEAPSSSPDESGPIVLSHVPHHIERRYLRGKCYVFALALHRQLRLPLWGMFEDGDLHHAFVYDVPSGEAIDIRGKRPLGRIADGALTTNVTFRPITRADILNVVGDINRADRREANAVVTQYFSGMQEG